MLPIWVPWKDAALKCQVNGQSLDEIYSSGEKPTIHFLPERIVLKIQDEIIFSKSNTFMYHGQRGNEWKRHIQDEHKTKGYAVESEMETIDRHIAPEVELMRPNPHRAGQNAARRQQLLEGTDCHCKGQPKGYGRVTLRGPLCFLVPCAANFSSVWVHCDLLERGHTHPESCAENAQHDDPAKRLGVRVRYKLRGSGEMKESWYKWNGECDTRKLKTLVDFLDGQGEEYTANQPRRFLSKKKGKNARPEI